MHIARMLPVLLNPEDKDDVKRADSAYSSKRFKNLLNLGRFDNRIKEECSRNSSLSEAAAERNSITSKSRV